MTTRIFSFASGTLALLLVSAPLGANAQTPPPAPSPEGPRLVVTYVDVAPASEAQAVALLKAYRDASRRDEGNRSVEIWQQQQPRGRFVLVEEWRDESARQKHRESAHVTQFHEKLKPLLNAEQQQKFQAMREGFRRRLIEEMAEKAVSKLGSEVRQWFTEKSSK